MNRGYAGFYKGSYLRSSYEYAYAKYLDFFRINWRYEQQTFDIGFKYYKPDFFIYNEDQELIRISEVKSRNKKLQQDARIALDIIKTDYGIKGELITYEKLLDLYRSLPFSLTSTIDEWIKSEDTTVNKVTKGILNPHFNLKHSEQTKRQIGEHTKKLWATNSISKMKMLEGLRKSGLSQKGKIKTPRITLNCVVCGNEFKILKTSNQKYCSRKCAGSINLKSATEHYVKERQEIHNQIKNYIIKWSLNNKKLVLSTPFNKINTTLKPLWREIENKYGVKDFRVISASVFGKDCGRKQLLQFMKETVKYQNENIC